jgi:L-malate glycosyltransferase
VKVIVAGVRPDDAVTQHWSQRLGLPAELIFPGLQSDVREIIALGNVGFVLSYAVETISFACREMMSMGLPMMVSDYAGLPENIDEGQDGWILPVKNIQAIQECLVKILMGEDVSTMGTRAREKSIHSFSNELFVKKTLDFYQEVLD